MTKKGKVPDAWDDDDWEAQVDQSPKNEPEPELQAPITRAERLARHAETQRKLWESAEEETPEEVNFLSTSNAVPLATAFKPTTMKVLSRKPAPKMISRRDPITGLEQLTLQDDDEDDGESNKHQPTPEEIRMRQQRELEEKQRRYDEARAKIFGDPGLSSGQSSPGNVTPPQSEGRQNYKGKNRGRGGGGAIHRSDSRQDNQSRRQPSSQQSSTRELFDPSYSPKPNFNLSKRGGDVSPQPGRSLTSREEDQVIRAPRGPDGSGRGGFGFARRGAQDG
ncbi:hypothetical protein B0T22DRAFT_477430 [Podospora appendiculata]|uniref:SUZ domain-containing protein n=1 Tax=Podospora appendiculata TaxID=314037 RepID=A0AAE0XK11_9PEZI|nr:hypothetical protein B0T22DRAFT_477430 [Podospora appendiculata]